MNLYIVRHAEAVEGNERMPDEWRYLTDKGRTSAQSLGKRLYRQGMSSCLIISSPLVRAVQTAQIIAERCGRKCRLETSEFLLSDTDPQELIAHLRNMHDSKRVMVVGHEPHLGLLASALLKREEDMQLKKASCLVVKLDPDQPDQPAKFTSYLVEGKKAVKVLAKAF